MSSNVISCMPRAVTRYSASSTKNASDSAGPPRAAGDSTIQTFVGRRNRQRRADDGRAEHPDLEQDRRVRDRRDREGEPGQRIAGDEDRRAAPGQRRQDEPRGEREHERRPDAGNSGVAPVGIGGGHEAERADHHQELRAGGRQRMERAFGLAAAIDAERYRQAAPSRRSSAGCKGFAGKGAAAGAGT